MSCDNAVVPPTFHIWCGNPLKVSLADCMNACDEITGSNLKCPVCLDEFRESEEPIMRLKNCRHEFHRSCYIGCVSASDGVFSCPCCKAFIARGQGNSPPGSLQISYLSSSCSGFEIFGSWKLEYILELSSPRTCRALAFVPASPEGTVVKDLLAEAFENGFTFRVGQLGSVLWNGILHKSSQSGGSGGFPDPNWLPVVFEQLCARGVVPNPEVITQHPIIAEWLGIFDLICAPVVRKKSEIGSVDDIATVRVEAKDCDMNLPVPKNTEESTLSLSVCELKKERKSPKQKQVCSLSSSCVDDDKIENDASTRKSLHHVAEGHTCSLSSKFNDDVLFCSPPSITHYVPKVLNNNVGTTHNTTSSVNVINLHAANSCSKSMLLFPSDLAISPRTTIARRSMRKCDCTSKEAYSRVESPKDFDHSSKQDNVINPINNENRISFNFNRINETSLSNNFEDSTQNCNIEIEKSMCGVMTPVSNTSTIMQSLTNRLSGIPSKRLSNQCSTSVNNAKSEEVLSNSEIKVKPTNNSNFSDDDASCGVDFSVACLNHYNVPSFAEMSAAGLINGDTIINSPLGFPTPPPSMPPSLILDSKRSDKTNT